MSGRTPEQEQLALFMSEMARAGFKGMRQALPIPPWCRVLVVVAALGEDGLRAVEVATDAEGAELADVVSALSAAMKAEGLA